MENTTMFENLTIPDNSSIFDNDTDESAISSRGGGFPPILMAFISLQQMVFVFSLLGNLTVIIVFTKYITPSITSRFIINLAINDICTGLSAGSQVFYFIYRDLSKNMYGCFLRYQVVSVMTFASQFNVTFITIDRFIAICMNPMYQNLMTKRVSSVMIAAAWIIPLLICSLPFMGLNKWDQGPRCSFAFIFYEWWYLIPSSTIFTLMLFTLTLYALILHKAFTFMRKSLSNTKEDAIERRKSLQKTIRSAKVTASITIAFILCWAPYEVYQFKYGLGDPSDLPTFDLSSWLVFLGIFNSMVNPFIYAFQRHDFRKGLKSMLCPSAWRKKKQEEALSLPSMSTAVSKYKASRSEASKYETHEE